MNYSIERNSLAVLITCYNRREKTLLSLEKLYDSSSFSKQKIDVFLVDDGSSDGTDEAVGLKFPDVEIIEGDGTLFWCGGMRLAFNRAMDKEYDFYLWLNDDTLLNENALNILLNTYKLIYEQTGQEAIIVGSVCDKDSMKLTYGGLRKGVWWRPVQYELIQPSQLAQQCDLFNGNCVLISKKIANATGNMSNSYKQGPGDIDYARRAAKKGFGAWICQGYIGTCSKNDVLERWRDKKLSLKDRVKALKHPMVILRTKDWLIYSRKYHKILFPYFFISAIIKLKMPWLYLLFKTLR